MKWLLSYIVVAEHIYNAFAPLYSTNWSICYFTSYYLSLSAFALLAIKRSNSREIPFYLTITLGWCILAVTELSKWGMSYEQYLISGTNIWMYIAFSSVVIPLLIVSYYGKN